VTGSTTVPTRVSGISDVAGDRARSPGRSAPAARADTAFAPLFTQARRELAALSDLGRSVPSDDPRRVRQAAVLLLSQLFFAPLLAEVRRSPLRTEIGSGGRAEEVFGEQLDLRIADAVAARADGVLDPLMASLDRHGPRGVRPADAHRLADRPTESRK